MADSRKKADWPVVAALGVVALLLALPVVYVGGYFLLPETSTRNFPQVGVATVRVFDAKWEVQVYQPMARIESQVSGRRILLSYRE
jgi:hypothetical protein